MKNTSASGLQIQMADAIRNISAMISNGADKKDVCSAAVQCAVAMLHGARAVIAEVNEDPPIATIVAAANAPFVSAGQQIGLEADSILQQAVAQPVRVHNQDCEKNHQLCASSAGYSTELDEIILAKAVPSSAGRPAVMAIVCVPEASMQATTVLMTLSELLVALFAGHKATVLHSQSLVEIARAKQEWERTVDALPEVVCLIDQIGNVVRANRTVERWQLAKVNAVRGLHIHDLLHRNCEAPACAMRDAVSLTMAAQTSNGYLESAVTDELLGKTLIVHTRLMNGLPLEACENSNPCAVVVVTDITALHQAKQDIAELNVGLENRVLRRTEDLEASNRELAEEVERRRATEKLLQNSRDELAELSQQLINAQEDERRRLSRELHDSLGQSLGAIKYSLERVLAMHENPEHGDPVNEVTAIIDRVQLAIRETRTMAVNLRPPVLDDIGTAAAIGWLCQHFADTFAHLDFHIEIDVPNLDIPDAIATPIYRIVQEALNNVVKHASAKTVMVALRLEEDALRLEVLDDGVGFDSRIGDTGTYQHLGKIGRLGMRERALNSNGALTIESWPGEGTRVIGEWSLLDVQAKSELEK